jgi:hypothetical protein
MALQSKFLLMVATFCQDPPLPWVRFFSHTLRSDTGLIPVLQC